MASPPNQIETMNTKNETPEPENEIKQETGGDRPSTSCCGFFICPDGDMHSIRPVESIWIEEIGHWWNRKHRVHLQFKGEDTHTWEWDKKTRDEAVSVRDRLISILHNVDVLAPAGEKTPTKPQDD